MDDGYGSNGEDIDIPNVVYPEISFDMSSIVSAVREIPKFRSPYQGLEEGFLRWFQLEEGISDQGMQRLIAVAQNPHFDWKNVRSITSIAASENEAWGLRGKVLLTHVGGTEVAHASIWDQLAVHLSAGDLWDRLVFAPPNAGRIEDPLGGTAGGDLARRIYSLHGQECRVILIRFAIDATPIWRANRHRKGWEPIRVLLASLNNQLEMFAESNMFIVGFLREKQEASAYFRVPAIQEELKVLRNGFQLSINGSIVSVAVQVIGIDMDHGERGLITNTAIGSGAKRPCSFCELLQAHVCVPSLWGGALLRTEENVCQHFEQQTSFQECGIFTDRPNLLGIFKPLSLFDIVSVCIAHSGEKGSVARMAQAMALTLVGIHGKRADGLLAERLKQLVMYPGMRASILRSAKAGVGGMIDMLIRMRWTVSEFKLVRVLLPFLFAGLLGDKSAQWERLATQNAIAVATLYRSSDSLTRAELEAWPAYYTATIEAFYKIARIAGRQFIKVHEFVHMARLMMLQGISVDSTLYDKRFQTERRQAAFTSGRQSFDLELMIKSMKAQLFETDVMVTSALAQFTGGKMRLRRIALGKGILGSDALQNYVIQKIPYAKTLLPRVRQPSNPQILLVADKNHYGTGPLFHIVERRIVNAQGEVLRQQWYRCLSFVETTVPQLFVVGEELHPVEPQHVNCSITLSPWLLRDGNGSYFHFLLDQNVHAVWWIPKMNAAPSVPPSLYIARFLTSTNYSYFCENEWSVLGSGAEEVAGETTAALDRSSSSSRSSPDIEIADRMAEVTDESLGNDFAEMEDDEFLFGFQAEEISELLQVERVDPNGGNDQMILYLVSWSDPLLENSWVPEKSLPKAVIDAFELVSENNE